MKKLAIVLTVIGASVFTTQVKAQSKTSSGDFHFAAGLDLGLPVGDAHNISSFVLGGKVQGEYSFNENVTGVGSIAYDHYFGKSIDLGGGFGTYKVNYGAVPIMVGPRFYPSENFFVGAQIGVGFFTGDASGSGFAYAPQVGYNADNFQAILAYNAISKSGGTIANIGLTFLYKFGGGK
jgi:hypothetical protein